MHVDQGRARDRPAGPGARLRADRSYCHVLVHAPRDALKVQRWVGECVVRGRLRIGSAVFALVGRGLHHGFRRRRLHLCVAASGHGRRRLLPRPRGRLGLQVHAERRQGGVARRRRRRVPSAHRLQLDHVSVHAVGALHELVVGALLDDAALVHHGDDVGRLHGREAVRNREPGPAGANAVQRLLHEPLALRVQRRRGLVQQQDPWAAQQRPGDGDSLLLPT